MVNQSYIVLGMHRSGTSLTAMIMHQAGINMLHGAVLGPAKENPEGYYECRSILDLNDKILRMAGGSWWDPPDRDSIITAGLALGPRIQQTFRNMSKGKWGFKDPRTCLTFPALDYFLESPKLVVVTRNKEAVFKSWQTTRYSAIGPHRRTREAFDVLYDRYLDEIRIAMAIYDHISLTFEAFFDGVNQTKDLLDFLNTGASVDEAMKLVKNQHRRNG